MILRGWLDLYSFAQLVEDMGIGTWACWEASPSCSTACLREGLMRFVGEDLESEAILTTGNG